MKSSLSNCQLENPASDEELEIMRRRAYHEQDIYIFTPTHRQQLGFTQAMTLEALAIQIYGKRRK
jgi:hypothetical protein